VPLYEWARQLNPAAPRTVGYASCLLEVGRYDQAKAEALEVIRTGGDLSMPRRVIFLADSAKAASVRQLSNGTSPTVAVQSPGKPPESMQKTAPERRSESMNR
jgi:hypothetical protein